MNIIKYFFTGMISRSFICEFDDFPNNTLSGACSRGTSAEHQHIHNKIVEVEHRKLLGCILLMMCA